MYIKLSLLKNRANFLIFSSVVVAFMLLIALVGYFFAKSIISIREKEIQNAVNLNVQRINTLTNSMQEKTKDLAKMGETFYRLQKESPQQNFDSKVEKFLVATFKDFPDAIGGGVWYEPFEFDKTKKYYGPYAYWGKDSVIFTWDLSNEKYDYFKWDWYLMALPKEWDRKEKRAKSFYWSAPYIDGAGTGAMMTTVDAFMYDENKKIIGISTVDWALTSMLLFLEKTKITPQSQSFLVHDESQLILSYTLNPKFVMGKTDKIEWVKKLKPSDKNVVSIENLEIDSVNYMIFYTSTDSNMTYGIMVPTGEIYESVRDMVLISIAIALFFTIIILVILSRNISLSDALEKIERISKELQIKNEQVSATLLELQETQKQLIESEKMASLGSVVAGVAHEVNTPLGVAITAMSYLYERLTFLKEHFLAGQMKKSDLEGFLQSATESADIITSNLSRSAKLIQSFKQVAVDQSSEHVRVFNLCQYIDELLLSLKHEYKSRKIEISVNCASDITIKSYPGALAQILTNLFMNSLMHAFDINDDGKIEISVEQDEKSSIIMSFSDNGKGMSKEVCAKIYEPFFTTARNKGGSGLGMHLIYNLVTHQLKGSIECQSELGLGSIFKIRFPKDVSIGR